MKTRGMRRWCAAALAAAVVAGGAGAARAQAVRATLEIVPERWRLAAHVVVPQVRAFAVERREAAIVVTSVAVAVDVLEQVATTTMDIALRNDGGAREEAVLLVPVPDGAVVRGFTFQGAAAEPSAEILPRERAREIYNGIVAKLRDPALLEFAGYNAVRSSVFPVEARGTQKVRLIYECLLKADGPRVDFELPRSEGAGAGVPWRIAMGIKSTRPIATVYSPTHEIAVERKEPGRVLVRLAEGDVQPGPFQVSYLLEDKEVTASLLAYPDPKVNGGYFLLLAGLPAALRPDESIRREVTLVLDRSGSMNGSKLQQARAAALQVLGGLRDGEAFNIAAYHESVDLFAPAPVICSVSTRRAAGEFLNGIVPRGGTNIHDALLEALRQKPTPGFLPIVLFLTDGLPTVGETSERAIGRLVETGNPHGRRVFAFGVGVDVNAPLLDRIGELTRATSTYVLPEEDIEVKVAGVFDRLAGPVLAGPRLEIAGADGAAPGRVRDVLPATLPDVFRGDQVVVLGQYVGDAPLAVTLSGNYLGREKTFRFRFGLDKATTRNAFVARLWASRKIAVLIDAVRQAGAAPGTSVLAAAPSDPRLKELMEEIVRLSTEFGVLTEYTAFLAREGTDLGARNAAIEEVERNLRQQAMQMRSGAAAVSQSLNVGAQSRQKVLNPANAYLDRNLNRVQVAQVQQSAERAYYQRGGRWVDSRLAGSRADAAPDTVVAIGSPEFLKLAERMSAENRQGAFALRGELLLEVDGRKVLCR